MTSTDDLKGLSIKELRALIASAGLTTTGCVDKADLIERAAEAQQVLASGGGKATPSAKAIEAEVARLEAVAVLPALEAALQQPPSQDTALKANACLERVTHMLVAAADSSQEPAGLPRDRLLAAILGGLKMGLGGQGGLFTMACLPLPFALQQAAGDDDDDEDDAQDLIERAEAQHETTFFDALLAGLAKFDGEETQGSILMTLRVWLSCLIENDGEDEMVALCDGDPTQLMEMLNAGLLPLVVRGMAIGRKTSQSVGSGLAILSAVCGYNPPEAVESIVLAAGAMTPIIDALDTYAGDLEMIQAGIPILKALTQRKAGQRSERRRG